MPKVDWPFHKLTEELEGSKKQKKKPKQPVSWFDAKSGWLTQVAAGTSLTGLRGQGRCLSNHPRSKLRVDSKRFLHTIVPPDHVSKHCYTYPRFRIFSRDLLSCRGPLSSSPRELNTSLNAIPLKAIPSRTEIQRYLASLSR